MVWLFPASASSRGVLQGNFRQRAKSTSFAHFCETDNRW